MTRDQAFAFAETLVGFIDLCEQSGKPKSEHALTHLHAALGQNKAPTTNELWQVQRANNKYSACSKDDRDRVAALAKFLQDAGTAILSEPVKVIGEDP